LGLLQRHKQEVQNPSFSFSCPTYLSLWNVLKWSSPRKLGLPSATSVTICQSKQCYITQKFGFWIDWNICFF
jgi:hypothetical protein